VSTVNYILKKLGHRLMEPIKEKTETEIKDEQAIQEIQAAVRESLQRRKKCLEVLEAIRDRPPIKVTTPKGEITLDDAPLKVRVCLAINELQNSLDELLGIRDVAIRKELDRLNGVIARIEKRLKEGAGNSSNS